jgi:hypothetical protein
MICCPAAATLLLNLGHLALLPLRGPAPVPAALPALRLMPAALPPAGLALPAAGAGCVPADAGSPASTARTWACAAECACCATMQLAGASAAVGVLLDGCWLSPDLLAAAGAVAGVAAVAVCPAVSAASCCQAPAATPSAPSSSASFSAHAAAASMRVRGLLQPFLLAYKPAGAGAGARGESVTG